MLARTPSFAGAVVVLVLAIACGDSASDSKPNAANSNEEADAGGAAADGAANSNPDPPGGGDAATLGDAAADQATAGSHAPTVTNGMFEVEIGESFNGTIAATDVDGDPLTFTIVTPPTRGALTSFDPATGAFTYTANAGSAGSDSFFFEVSDGTNPPVKGFYSVKVTSLLFTGAYTVTQVKDNGASCGDGDFRLGHATPTASLGAYFAITQRRFVCGSTTYTFDPGRFTVGGSTTITSNAITFSQSKSVSGCGTVTEEFSMSRTGVDFDFKEKIQVPCFGVGTHEITGKATRAPAAYLFFEPIAKSFGTVLQNDPAVTTASLRNVGQLSASTLAVTAPDAPFSFVGGAYPGTGGTCGTQLAPLSSCTVAMQLDTSALSSPTSTTVTGSYVDGTATYSDTFSMSGQVVPKLTNVTEIAAAGNHQCALANGQVTCWGASTAPTGAPTDLVNPRKLTTGAAHACVIDDSGVRCWGSNTSGQSTPPALTSPTSVSAGNTHTCAIDATGVHCWGLDTSGQSTVPALSNPTMVSAGSAHTCALDATGVHCWGNNTKGESAVPALTNPTAVSAGGGYTCAIDATGLHCWGDNFANKATPVVLPSPTVLDAGNQMACALDGGKLACWGFFSGNVPKLTGVSAIAVGDHHVCALVGTSMSCYLSGSRTYP